MARPRYALAKHEADELLKKAGVTQPPVPVAEIAEGLCGAVVQYEPFARSGTDTMAGALLRRPGQPPIIGINKDDVEARQRFSIAHELGHLVMHNDTYHVDTKMFLRDKTSSTAESVLEIEANQFAANLLMPAWLLEHDLQKLDVIDVDETAEVLAARYNVSVQAMTLRIAKLLKYGL